MTADENSKPRATPNQAGKGSRTLSQADAASHQVEATEEQAAARDAFTVGRDLALVAGAGTGKTSTLVMMDAASRRLGMYIAFDKPIVQEAKTRSGTNVRCSTSHGLA
ncbi:hypothetical protein [Streptomyces sp. NPDC088180]|uniref:hypothetical protein n=1 Tax=Streptomyces sp. NPDC088180 TaxID=3365837 RepID=UPI003801CB32